MIRYFIYSWMALSLLGTPAMATDHSALDAFPEPEAGIKRLVLYLPDKEREEEANFRVEMRAGKNFVTDGINRYQLAGRLEQKNLKGWGYHYYEYAGGTELIGTLMGVPEGTPMVERFIGSAPLSIPYNSRLPVVLYLPGEMSAQYRIWSTSREFDMFEED